MLKTCIFHCIRQAFKKKNPYMVSWAVSLKSLQTPKPFCVWAERVNDYLKTCFCFDSIMLLTRRKSCVNESVWASRPRPSIRTNTLIRWLNRVRMAATMPCNDAATCHSPKPSVHRSHSSFFCPLSLPEFETRHSRRKSQKAVKEFKPSTAYEVVPTALHPREPFKSHQI